MQKQKHYKNGLVKIPFTAKYYMVYKARVDGASMEPTLLNGDKLYCVNCKRRPVEIKRNDLVVALNDDKTKIIIKRAVAIAGDLVKARSLYSSVDVIPKEKINKTKKYGGYTKIKPGYIYVQGDNYKNSKDSRYYGAIPRDHIIGLVFRIKQKTGKINLYTVDQVVNKWYDAKALQNKETVGENNE